MLDNPITMAKKTPDAKNESLCKFIANNKCDISIIMTVEYNSS